LVDFLKQEIGLRENPNVIPAENPFQRARIFTRGSLRPHNPNDISIDSTVFAQFTDRPSDATSVAIGRIYALCAGDAA